VPEQSDERCFKFYKRGQQLVRMDDIAFAVALYVHFQPFLFVT
jgi:hypothetical protein